MTYTGKATRKVGWRGTLEERLDRMTIRSEHGCWEWIGYRHGAGYGMIGLPGSKRQARAHRAMYERYCGPIPEGLQLDHLCRNPSCVRPDHLEPVTGRENLLRGRTFQAANAAKTHCPKGHPLSGANLALCRGSRVCRECQRANGLAYRQRHLEERRRRQRERAREVYWMKKAGTYTVDEKRRDKMSRDVVA